MTLKKTDNRVLSSRFRRVQGDDSPDYLPATDGSDAEEAFQKSLEDLQTQVKGLDETANQLSSQNVTAATTVKDLSTRLVTLEKAMQSKPPKKKKKKTEEGAGGAMMFPGFGTSLATDPELAKMYEGMGTGEEPGSILSEGPPTLESLQADIQAVNGRLEYLTKVQQVRTKEISVLQTQVQEAEDFLGLGTTEKPVETPEEAAAETPVTPPWQTGEEPDTTDDVLSNLDPERTKEEFNDWFENLNAPGAAPQKPTPKVTPEDRKEWDSFLKELETSPFAPKKPEAPVPAPQPAAPSVTPESSFEEAFPKEVKAPSALPQTLPKGDTQSRQPQLPLPAAPPAAKRPVPDKPPPSTAPQVQKGAPQKAPEPPKKKKGPAWGEEKEEDWTPKPPPKKKKDEEDDDEYAPAVPQKKQKERRTPREKVQDSHYYTDNPSSDDMLEMIKQDNQRDRKKR
jgi:hypothetical protein